MYWLLGSISITWCNSGDRGILVGGRGNCVGVCILVRGGV